MKERVKEKQDACTTLISSSSNGEVEVNFVWYKHAKKIAKKAVTLVRNNSYERSYQKLESMEGEKDVLKLVRAREMKTRDLGM